MLSALLHNIHYAKFAKERRRLLAAAALGFVAAVDERLPAGRKPCHRSTTHAHGIAWLGLRRVGRQPLDIGRRNNATLGTALFGVSREHFRCTSDALTPVNPNFYRTKACALLRLP